MDLPKFKIGITFSGKYRREYVEPICEELLKLGYSRKDIFYDRWHEAIINGTRGADTLQRIYNQQCELVVVLLSPDYWEKNWCGKIEWSSVRELINTGRDEKICLLRIGNVDIDKIDGLYKYQAIIKEIDDMPSVETARFIKQVYYCRFHPDDILNDDSDILKHWGSGDELNQIMGIIGHIVVRAEWKAYFAELVADMTKEMAYSKAYRNTVKLGKDKRKSREQLYDYIRKNIHTQDWIQLFENAGEQEIAAWRGCSYFYEEDSYHAKKIKNNYWGPAGELYLILMNKCYESVNISDVRIVTDWIFQDIAEKLTTRLGKPSHHVIMRINGEGEGLFFIGPRTLPEDILFSDNGIFMTVGYDVMIGFLERSGGPLPKLYRYLEDNGFSMNLKALATGAE